MISPFSFGARLRLLLPIGAAVSIAAFAAATAPCQNPFTASLPLASAPAKSKKKQNLPQVDKNAPQPAIVLPTTPLGFAAPAPFYIGDHFAQASLNFLDEDTLLFTFRVPGLIAREHPAPGEPPSDERHIRALTLSLPTGKVTAESLWALHDYSPYLWMLKGGKFLLRDRNMLQIGDASLHLEPFLRFPGPVNTIEFDPSQDWLVADTTEPPATAQDLTDAAPANTLSAATITADGQPDMNLPKSRSDSQELVRIFNMQTRKLMLFSRVSQSIHLPIDGEGYYEALRGEGARWLISFEYFQGQSRPLGWIDSTCNPALDAIAPGIVLASGCTAYGGRHLAVLSRDRDKDHYRLWDAMLPPTKVWPQLATSADGLRLARATLEISHPISPYSPLESDDIRGQSVQVYDLADGKVELTLPASPVLDAGGNFALSPSGRRFAVLDQGAIRVFDLPPAPSVQPPAPLDAAKAKP